MINIEELKAKLRSMKARFARSDNQRNESGQRESAAIRQLDTEIKKLEKEAVNGV